MGEFGVQEDTRISLSRVMATVNMRAVIMAGHIVRVSA